MAKNPLTSSERRGIVAVAALALLITGGGICLSRCGMPEPMVTPADVEILLDGTSLKNEVKDSPAGKGKRDSAKHKRRQKNDSLSDKKNQKGTRIYRKRSLLDENVERD
ncbi:MAG: hypothetical protein K2I16_00910 [Muribaculaceae bacterium]|nr:hypothetical protein [Muribaculaceae bacterium]